MSTTYLSRGYRRLIVAIALSAAFLSVLTQFLLITAFPKIMEEFAINSTQVQWLTTSFMLTIAVMIPMTAYLIDRFPTRKLMMGAMSLFLVGTVICLVAPTFSILIIGRIIQGAGSGVLMPLMQTILFLVYPRDKRGFAMGMAGLVINVAPAVGPPISGLLIHAFPWRAVFFLTLPIAAAVLLVIFLYMQNITEQRETHIDFASIILSSIGFGGTLYGFNTIESGGIDGWTLAIMMAGIAAIILFVIRQFRLEIPILNLRVMKVPVFALVALISILGFSLLISIETILPLYVQNAQELSALQSGLIVAPGALTLAVMSLMAGKLFDLYGGKSITLIGFTLLAVSTIGFNVVLGLETSFIFTALAFMVSMAGVGLINMPIMTAGINALPNKLVPHGTSIINTARQFGGSVGLTFIISFISMETGSDAAGAEPADYLLGVKTAFLVAFLFSLTGLILSFFLKKEKQTAEE